MYDSSGNVCSQGLSTETKIMVGAGCGAMGLVLIALGTYLLVRLRRSNTALSRSRRSVVPERPRSAWGTPEILISQRRESAMIQLDRANGVRASRYGHGALAGIQAQAQVAGSRGRVGRDFDRAREGSPEGLMRPASRSRSTDRSSLASSSMMVAGTPVTHADGSHGNEQEDRMETFAYPVPGASTQNATTNRQSTRSSRGVSFQPARSISHGPTEPAPVRLQQPTPRRADFEHGHANGRLSILSPDPSVVSREEEASSPAAGLMTGWRYSRAGTASPSMDQDGARPSAHLESGSTSTRRESRPPVLRLDLDSVHPAEPSAFGLFRSDSTTPTPSSGGSEALLTTPRFGSYSAFEDVPEDQEEMLHEGVGGGGYAIVRAGSPGRVEFGGKQQEEASVDHESILDARTEQELREWRYSARTSLPKSPAGQRDAGDVHDVYAPRELRPSASASAAPARITLSPVVIVNGPDNRASYNAAMGLTGGPKRYSYGDDAGSPGAQRGSRYGDV